MCEFDNPVVEMSALRSFVDFNCSAGENDVKTGTTTSRDCDDNEDYDCIGCESIGGSESVDDSDMDNADENYDYSD